MHFLFTSDLHLQDGNTPQSERFIRFLNEVPQSGDVLVLGGDIFDLFVGNKSIFQTRFSKVLEAIQSLIIKGVRVYYLEGNHDFQFNGTIPESENFKILKNDFSLEVFGKKIWISHGDLIDPEDRGYRFLRWFTRTPFIQILIKILPGNLIDMVGNRSSQSSRKYNDRRVNDKTKKRLRSLYFAFADQKIAAGFEYVLVGHSHIKDFRKNLGGYYINLGFSAEHVNFAQISGSPQAVEIKEFY
jgi:UDP-2,3-diacylglucosamine hydrolase